MNEYLKGWEKIDSFNKPGLSTEHNVIPSAFRWVWGCDEVYKVLHTLYDLSTSQCIQSL